MGKADSALSFSWDRRMPSAASSSPGNYWATAGASVRGVGGRLAGSRYYPWHWELPCLGWPQRIPAVLTEPSRGLREEIRVRLVPGVLRLQIYRAWMCSSDDWELLRTGEGPRAAGSHSLEAREHPRADCVLAPELQENSVEPAHVGPGLCPLSPVPLLGKNIHQPWYFSDPRLSVPSSFIPTVICFFRS